MPTRSVLATAAQHNNKIKTHLVTSAVTSEGWLMNVLLEIMVIQVMDVLRRQLRLKGILRTNTLKQPRNHRPSPLATVAIMDES